MQHDTFRASTETVTRAMQQNDVAYNNFKFLKCIPRTMVVIGRTRTGKSTMAEVLKDPTYVPPPAQLYSQTKTVHIKNIAAYVKLQNEETVYSISIIDTPGFFDRVQTAANTDASRDRQQTGANASNSSVQRQLTTASATIMQSIPAVAMPAPAVLRDENPSPLSNDTIKEYIDQCLYNDITQIHVFAFVFNALDSINEEDIGTMKYFKQHYANLSKNFALILTHCEELSEEQCSQKVEQFFQDSDVHKSGLREYFQKGIHFMGCVRERSFAHGNMAAVSTEMRNVLRMRETFIKFLFADHRPYNIHNEQQKDSQCKIL